jgi:hypothetical protein
VLVLLLGAVGNVISAAIGGVQYNQMGCQVGIFAIFGAGLSFLIFNWKNMEGIASQRNTWLCQSGIIIFLGFYLNSSVGSLMDNFAGFIAGLAIGLCFAERYLAG